MNAHQVAYLIIVVFILIFAVNWVKYIQKKRMKNRVLPSVSKAEFDDNME